MRETKDAEDFKNVRICWSLIQRGFRNIWAPHTIRKERESYGAPLVESSRRLPGFHTFSKAQILTAMSSAELKPSPVTNLITANVKVVAMPMNSLKCTDLYIKLL